MFSTVGLSFFVLSMPFVTFLILKSNFLSLSNANFTTRFGSLYKGLNAKRIHAVLHSVIFFARRMLFTLSIVFFEEIPLLQASLQVTMSMCLLAYMLWFKPFNSKRTF